MIEQKDTGGIPAQPVPQRKKSDDTVIFTAGTPTALDEKDAIERLIEGLKYAASQARELNARQHNCGWHNVRESLLAMVKSVRNLATQKPETRGVIVKKLDHLSHQIGGGEAA